MRRDTFAIFQQEFSGRESVSGGKGGGASIEEALLLSPEAPSPKDSWETPAAPLPAAAAGDQGSAGRCKEVWDRPRVSPRSPGCNGVRAATVDSVVLSKVTVSTKDLFDKLNSLQDTYSKLMATTSAPAPTRKHPSVQAVGPVRSHTANDVTASPLPHSTPRGKAASALRPRTPRSVGAPRTAGMAATMAATPRTASLSRTPVALTPSASTPRRFAGLRKPTSKGVDYEDWKARRSRSVSIARTPYHPTAPSQGPLPPATGHDVEPSIGQRKTQSISPHMSSNRENEASASFQDQENTLQRPLSPLLKSATTPVSHQPLSKASKDPAAAAAAASESVPGVAMPPPPPVSSAASTPQAKTAPKPPSGSTLKANNIKTQSARAPRKNPFDHILNRRSASQEDVTK